MTTPRRFADVALPLPIDQLFTYSIPESLLSRVAVGMRVLVPMQRRIETGYIIDLKDSTEVEKVRDLIDLPDEEALFTPSMLELCKWISEYYCCSLGEALQTAAPPGLNIRTQRRYTLLPDQLSTGRYTDRQREVIAALHRSGPLTEKQLAKEVGAKALSNTLMALERRGLIMGEALAVNAGVSMKTETWLGLVEEAVPDNEALAQLQRRAPKQAAIYLDLLNNAPLQRTTALSQRHGTSSTTIRQLEAKGLVIRSERELYRAPDLDSHGAASDKHLLNDEQQSAYDAITNAAETEVFKTFLLQGITGSGKTEVYLQAIERVLELGRDAIILVPEISLTPQTVGRFLARFNEKIAVLHSGLGAGERYDEWRRAQRGEVRIVVGARSAIFAPLPNVGIIIVDEEHDSSYKQSDTPRYHARDAAIMRSKLSDGVCVLGSATPSVESYHNTTTNKSTRLTLLERATNASLPKVQLLDMRIETKESGGQLTLAPALEKEVNLRVERGEQVILLLNRRGHSPFVLCPQCGWVAECKDCQVSLTYHARGSYLSCHYCNARRSVPQICDECDFNPLIFMGSGTQKVEEYLVKAFPDSRVERMDADTTAGKGGHAKILGRFAEGEIDILIGTQMIAKGHDYPGVTLVGVINADTGLSIPDFRSAEQSFQLLTQVAGRAGRGDKPGIVIIQTFRPKHYSVQAAAQHDFGAFFQQEIEYRKQAGYPPFRRMVNFMVEAEDGLEAERAAAMLHRVATEQVEALGFHGIELLGPSPATIRRVKRKYRWNLGALSKSPKRLNVLTRAVRDAYPGRAGSKVALKVDLDPYGMF